MFAAGHELCLWNMVGALPLNAAGEDTKAPYIQRAVQWLRDRKSDDGGWGEDGATYWEEERDRKGEHCFTNGLGRIGANGRR